MSPEELQYFRMELEKDASLRHVMVMGRRRIRQYGGRSVKKFGEGLSRWSRGRSWSKPKPPPSKWAGRADMAKGGLWTMGAAGAIGVGGAGYGLLSQPKSIRNIRQF